MFFKQMYLLYGCTYFLFVLFFWRILTNIGDPYGNPTFEKSETITDVLNTINNFLVEVFLKFFFISRQGSKYLFLLNLFKNSNIYLLLVVQWIDPQIKELIKSTMLEINVNNNSYMQDLHVKSGKDNQKLPEW